MNNTPEHFKHTHALELRYTSQAPDVWEALENTPRTGWVLRGIKNPESVAEHSHDMITRFGPLLSQFEELGEDDQRVVVEMFEVHDWAEARTGDLLPHDVAGNTAPTSPEDKYTLELYTMQDICKHISEGEYIFKLWLEYSDKNTLRAQIANQFDKAHAVIKAIHYEIEQDKPGLAWEFYTYAREKITHPIIRQYLVDQMSTPLVQQG